VYFVAEKLLKLFELAATSNMVRGPFTSRFGGVGSRHFETHGPRPHKALGSVLLIFERVSESKLRERVKQNKDHAE
jgi:hypothetical protein